MGSKRWMLENGLGTLLETEAATADRFIDLFSGTAAVSVHVARKVSVPVLAVDLQAYSAVLAESVLSRTTAFSSHHFIDQWVDRAVDDARQNDTWIRDTGCSDLEHLSEGDVEAAQYWCAGRNGITGAYGGFYFSPSQALLFDSLLRLLPISQPARSICHAALLSSATKCCAAPGHTAQPFRPTPSALPFIRGAWSQSPSQICQSVTNMISARFALKPGRGVVGNADDVARTVQPNDLVFVDPPYSAVQYSRFYHVLETIARGGCGSVEGAGRYPAPRERPRSEFSLKSQAANALRRLLTTLGERQCRVIMTFPQFGSSNGIVGDEIAEMVRPWFTVQTKLVPLRHSTLGGTRGDRGSRRQAVELILFMKPRRRI